MIDPITVTTKDNEQVKLLSHVWLFATPWTIAHQAPPSMEFSRQEYWSGLPFPSPGDLPDPGMEPGSPKLRADALSSEPLGNPIIKDNMSSNLTQLLTGNEARKMTSYWKEWQNQSTNYYLEEAVLQLRMSLSTLRSEHVMPPSSAINIL